MADNTLGKRLYDYIRRNIVTTLLLVLLAVLVFSPASKAWVMRQLLHTGIFDAQLIPAFADSGIVQGFSLRLASGQMIQVKDLRGKVVFLNFWASWCPPCRAELPGLANLYRHFSNNKNVVFLFIDEDDDIKTGDQFLRKENYTLPLAVRMGNIPSTVYQGSLPTTVIMDKTGRLRFHHEGFAGYDSPEWIHQLDRLVNE